MKKIVLLLFILFVIYNLNAQVCPISVHAQTQRISNDTTIVYSSIPLLKSWVPCIGKSVLLYSANTEIDTFYLREGTKLIIDSSNTLAGGFIIYADSGSYVDCNFHQVQQLYYTPNTVVLDTSSWGTRTLCNDLIFDFTQMLQPHDCIATRVHEIEQASPKVYTNGSDWQIQFSNQQIESYAYLFNLYGQQVGAYKIENNGLIIPHNLLANGLYFLKLKNGLTQESLKLLK